MQAGEIKAIVEDAAESASKKVVADLFSKLGVDVNDQDQMNDFRSDLVHVRKWRRLVERSAGHMVLVLLTSITLTLLGLLGHAVIEKIRG